MQKTTVGSTAYKTDRNKRKIEGGSSIVSVTETAVTDAAWTAISVPAAIYCKQVRMRTRAGGDFKISALAAGTTYMTVDMSVEGYVHLNMAGEPGDVICYVQMVAGNDTVELLLID